MSGSNDTSTIDEKKEENNGSSKKDINISGLLSAFVGGLIGIYIYYKIGSWLVYASAISASCELPTDIELPPYEGSAINSLKSKPVHIFDGKAIIQFPNDPDNLKYYFVDSLRNKKKKYTGTETWTSHMFDFWITFYESIFSLNYLVIQLILKFINKLGIPQIIILLLGPLCLFASFIILFIINWIYALFSWFTSLPIFVRNNPGLIEEIIGYITIVLLFIDLIVCAFCVIPIAIPILIIMFIVSLSFILYTGTITGNIKDGVNGSVGAGDILAGFLENYPRTLILFLCLYVISIFFQNLGSVAGFVSIVISGLILYYMDKLIEYYKNPPSLNMAQFFGKSSSAPIKVAAAAPKAAAPAPKAAAPAPKAAPAAPPKAAKATKGGGNFDFLKELKKLQ
jgi:hypothetical protein